jgi:hypothetical protein
VQAPQVDDGDYDSDEAVQVRHFNSEATTILRRLAHVRIKNLQKLIKGNRLVNDLIPS